MIGCQNPLVNFSCTEFPLLLPEITKEKQDIKLIQQLTRGWRHKRNIKRADKLKLNAQY